jgi:hypothetical protein
LKCDTRDKDSNVDDEASAARLLEHLAKAIEELGPIRDPAQVLSLGYSRPYGVRELNVLNDVAAQRDRESIDGQE